MTSWLWIEDHFEPHDSVPLTDRGFRYGMSVFESLRVTRGEPEFFDQHRSRLVQACAEREMALDDSVLDQVPALFPTGSESGFARIYVTAGDGPPGGRADDP